MAAKKKNVTVTVGPRTTPQTGAETREAIKARLATQQADLRRDAEERRAKRVRRKGVDDEL